MTGALLAGAPFAQATTPVDARPPERREVRLLLNWVFTGEQAPWLMAADRGGFQTHGLKVAVERGTGAADAVRRVADREFEIGVGDLSAVIEHNARNPADSVTAFYVVAERSPLAIISLAERGIRKPADLEGRTLGAPAGDIARRVFPAFAAAAGVDATKVRWESTEVALRETRLIAGDIDAISGYAGTATFLTVQGVAPERVRVMRYSDFGLDHYGTAFFARGDFIAAHPATIAAFARGANDALRAALAEPRRAIEALDRRLGTRARSEPELQRLRQMLAEQVATPAARIAGLSNVDTVKLQRQIATLRSALALPHEPPAAAVYTPAYLPPTGERTPRWGTPSSASPASSPAVPSHGRVVAPAAGSAARSLSNR